MIFFMFDYECSLVCKGSLEVKRVRFQSKMAAAVRSRLDVREISLSLESSVICRVMSTLG